MISILAPSRGRPEMAAKMVESAHKTAHGKIRIAFYLAKDDPKFGEYKKHLKGVEVSDGPDIATTLAWNMLAEACPNDLMLLGSDDIIFETQDWDKLMLEAAKPISVVAPSDGFEKGSHPHYAATRKWVETLGYLAPPLFYHFYVDTFTQAVATQANVFIPMDNVVVRHLKKRDKKGKTIESEMDDTALRIRKTGIWHRDNYAAKKVGRQLAHMEVLKVRQACESLSQE